MFDQLIVLSGSHSLSPEDSSELELTELLEDELDSDDDFDKRLFLALWGD